MSINSKERNVETISNRRGFFGGDSSKGGTDSSPGTPIDPQQPPSLPPLNACCRVCTENFYSQLSFLQVDESIKNEMIHKFDKMYSKVDEENKRNKEKKKKKLMMIEKHESSSSEPSLNNGNRKVGGSFLEISNEQNQNKLSLFHKSSASKKEEGKGIPGVSSALGSVSNVASSTVGGVVGVGGSGTPTEDPKLSLTSDIIPNDIMQARLAQLPCCNICIEQFLPPGQFIKHPVKTMEDTAFLQMNENEEKKDSSSLKTILKEIKNTLKVRNQKRNEENEQSKSSSTTSFIQESSLNERGIFSSSPLAPTCCSLCPSTPEIVSFLQTSSSKGGDDGSGLTSSILPNGCCNTCSSDKFYVNPFIEASGGPFGLKPKVEYLNGNEGKGDDNGGSAKGGLM